MGSSILRLKNANLRKRYRLTEVNENYSSCSITTKTIATSLTEESTVTTEIEINYSYTEA